MKVLIACEFSQVVCKAFRDKGHDAYSCDILPTEGNPKWHIQDDILKVLKTRFAQQLDLLGIHDPCTYQTNSGVRWLHERPGRWELLSESCLFTKALLDFDVPKRYRENPIPHKYARDLIGRDYDQCIQPHWFIGSSESKATCLWLRGLPLLRRTQWLDKYQIKQSVFKMPPSESRGLERSRFPLSIAKAMVEQWGGTG